MPSISISKIGDDVSTYVCPICNTKCTVSDNQFSGCECGKESYIQQVNLANSYKEQLEYLRLSILTWIEDGGQNPPKK